MIKSVIFTFSKLTNLFKYNHKEAWVNKEASATMTVYITSALSPRTNMKIAAIELSLMIKFLMTVILNCSRPENNQVTSNADESK